MSIGLFFFCFFLCNSLYSSAEDELHLLDGIVALLTGETGITPVFYSDAWHVSPLGGEKRIEQEIINSLWKKYGYEHGVVNSPAELNQITDQYLDDLQKQKNVSRNKIEKMALDLGYTIDDIKKELSDQFIIQNTLERSFVANGYLNVSNSEIIDYFERYPQIEPTIFVILIGTKEYNENKETIENTLAHDADIDWEKEPVMISEKDISEKFGNMNEYIDGQIFYTENNNEKKQTIYYRLIEKIPTKKISLEESYEGIVKKIQNDKYAESYKRMTLSFLDSSSIIYYDTKIKCNLLSFMNTSN